MTCSLCATSCWLMEILNRSHHYVNADHII